MSDVTKPIVLDETLQAFKELFGEKMDNQAVILASIGSTQGGLAFRNFADIKTLCRLGLADKVFHVCDQLECAKETAINATVGNSQGEAGITAAEVNEQTFIHAIGTTGNADYEFTWDGAVWHLDGTPVELSTYGITITGTPTLGDEIVVHETATSLIWDVIGVTKFSITLQLHDSYASLQFDSAEAFYYAENGLTAGTYHFTIASTYDTTYNTYKDTGYEFTLTQDVPAGGQLTFPWGSNVQASTIKVNSFASATATSPIEQVAVSSGTGGTDLGELTTAGDPTNNLNSIQRVRYGSNNYKNSALRQWLNSDKAKGTFWVPKTPFDRPPSWNATSNGWMYGLDDDFVAALSEVENVVALNTVSDGGGSTTVRDKFWLLSRPEIFSGKENSISEGAAYPYYSENSDLTTAGTGADSNRIKYRNGTAQYWWLRSPYAGNAGSVRGVDPDGSVHYSNAIYARGVAPACRIGESEIAS